MQIEEKPVRRLRDFGGTFLTPSFSHSGTVLASWQHNPQAAEENARVNAGDKTSEVWKFPGVGSNGSGWSRVKGLPKGIHFHSTRRTVKTVPLAKLQELASDEFDLVGESREVTRPGTPKRRVTRQAVEALSGTILQLLEMRPDQLSDVYHRAWTVKDNLVLDALLVAVRKVSDFRRPAVREGARRLYRNAYTSKLVQAIG